MKKTFTIEIDPKWIEDGYIFSAKDIQEAILDSSLVHAFPNEVRVEEVLVPDGD